MNELRKDINNSSIVVHACCAVCLCHPNEVLKEVSYDNIIFYFYNPNIFPIEEYERRKNELLAHAEKYNINVLVEESKDCINKWYGDIEGFEHEKEKGARCDICFYHRLNKTFEYAKKIGVKTVSTIMTISPHKSSKKLENIGKQLSDIFDIDYLPIDFKKQDGFKKTNILANENGLYRQDYCGCEFSIRKNDR